MSFQQDLLEDLSRQYYYSGTSGRPPTYLGVIIKSFSPRFLPVVIFRVSHLLYQIGLPPLAKLVSLVNFIFFGLEIAARSKIGGGLYLPHTQGTVLGAVGVGKNATIFHGVTLGAREVDLSFKDSGRPVVGDNVVIGAGAKVLGGISIGTGAKVGANAVVVEDVPPGATVVGIPARRI